MTYEERQNAKLEKYQELAVKNLNASESVRASSDRIAEVIPLGQPILIGHHSENKHRRDIEKIHNSMNKSIELKEKSEYYEKKAENILNPIGISSDDENAIPKLKEKLQDLETKREKYKEFNKKARKEKTEQLASYLLSNLGQNINSVKKRIEHLQSLNKIEESEITNNNITLKIDKEDNRVKLFFPDKPSEEIRTKLKSNGFRWSPFNSCWQRQINEWSINLAKEFIGLK